MKKHKGKIQMGIVIGIFSSILITCLVSVFSQLYTENKEKEEFRQLAEIVTEETTDATLEEIVRKPNLLKVSDSDNEVQAEQPVYYTTYYEPHSISELIAMNSECFGWISITGRKKEKVKNECFDFCLSFEKSEEHNEEGRKIDEVLKEEGIELEKRLK